MINAIAALLLAIYLYLVWAKERSDELLALLVRDLPAMGRWLLAWWLLDLVTRLEPIKSGRATIYIFLIFAALIVLAERGELQKATSTLNAILRGEGVESELKALEEFMN